DERGHPELSRKKVNVARLYIWRNYSRREFMGVL
ncbi:MAG: hypothetical protein ACI81V_000280, partial [Lentimonas sp.]